MIAFWIILTGSLVASCCSLLGCFLLLRKMSMVGDAISHAVLPGIVIAFLLSGNREPLTMLLGAGSVGLFTTFLIEYVHRKANLQTDASIGVSFTLLFAIGIILISVFANQVDIDQDCVLYGEIAYVPIDLWISDSGTILGPRAVYIVGTVLLVVATFIWLGYRPLVLSTFDATFATAIGISTSLWHYLLMGAVSLTTVASFELVGAILVVAFLVGPPATAYLLTRQLKYMLLFSVLCSIFTAFAGYWMAYWLNASIAGCMATVMGLLFLSSYLISHFRGKKRAK